LLLVGTFMARKLSVEEVRKVKVRLTNPLARDVISALLTPFSSNPKALPRIFWVVGGACDGFVAPQAFASKFTASVNVVGEAVGFAAFNSFWTTAGTSVPNMVPFSIAPISISLGNLRDFGVLTDDHIGSLKSSSQIT
jgi:hypothetical protein